MAAETIDLIGGPYDGDTVTVTRLVTALRLPDVTAALVYQPAPDLTDTTITATTLLYLPLVDPLGYPSRADTGHLRYQLAW